MLAKRRKRGHGWTNPKKKSKKSKKSAEPLYEIEVLRKIKGSDGKSVMLVHWKETDTYGWIPEKNLQSYRPSRDEPHELGLTRVYKELNKLSQQFDITSSAFVFAGTGVAMRYPEDDVEQKGPGKHLMEFEVNVPIEKGLWCGFIVPVTFSMGSYPFCPPQVGCGKGGVYHPNYDNKHGYWEIPMLAPTTWIPSISIEKIVQDLLRVFHHPDLSPSPNPELLSIRKLYQHNRRQFEVNVERSLNGTTFLPLDTLAMGVRPPILPVGTVLENLKPPSAQTE